MISMINAENPHRERFPWCHITYWKDGVPCGRCEGWTRMRVEAIGAGQTFYLEFDPIGDAGPLLEMLRKAYEQGRREKAREVRRVLELER